MGASKDRNWASEARYEIVRHARGVVRARALHGSGEMTKEIDRRLKVSDTVIRTSDRAHRRGRRGANRATAQRKAASARRRVARGLPPEPDPE